MGFGKFLLGAACAVGAVIAAPVVLPVAGAAAAAAGTVAAGAAATVGSAAAAVGTAAAGAAATVGSAAAAVGTAITSTAVGGAVAGVATTAAAGVGSAIGTAAGAVGLTSVATVTGTTAGAAAVGTIATTGAVGAATGISGAKKIAEAKEIKDSALYRYDSKKNEFEKVQEDANASLEKLGREKLKLWDSFNRFVDMYSKIQNSPVMNAAIDKESISLSADELDNIKAVAISVKELLSGGIGSVSAGGLIGMATSGGLASTITFASTGTAMSGLSGAAATNATLAAFGGGSLAAGGAGMAGGAVVLSGLTFAPMLMVGGIALNSKAKKSLEAAKDVEREVNSAVEKFSEAEKELKKVQNLSNRIRIELAKLNKKYLELMDFMESVVSKKTNYKQFTLEEKQCLEKTILVLKLIKLVSMQNILDSKNDNKILDAEVKQVLNQSKKAREEKLAA